MLGQQQPKHEYLYWEFNETIDFKKTQHKQAVRKGKWKGVYYIKEDRFELYDLRKDTGETRNVAEQHPEVVADLKRIMAEAHVPSQRFPLTRDEQAQAGR